MFESAAFTAAGFSALIALFSVVGVTFLLSLFLGYVQQLSALQIGWRLAIFGLSLAIMLTTVSVAAINAVPWKLAGMAAAANTAMRQYGSALGPAILGVIFVDRANTGASPTSALHTALAVNGILLAVAALACWLAARVPPGVTPLKGSKQMEVFLQPVT